MGCRPIYSEYSGLVYSRCIVHLDSICTNVQYPECGALSVNSLIPWRLESKYEFETVLNCLMGFEIRVVFNFHLLRCRIGLGGC